MAKTPPTDPVDTEADADTAAPPTKGRPTPTRKEREAERKRPLVPSDRRVAAKQSRSQVAAARERARVGMAAGEEKYLPLRDKGPQKRYVRDYIDARFSIGEFMLPLLFVVILASFVESIAAYAFIVVYGVILVIIVEAVIVGTLLRRKLAAKFGESKVERVRWYAFMRMIQMRILRLPKPQVKRGQFPS